MDATKVACAALASACCWIFSAFSLSSFFLALLAVSDAVLIRRFRCSESLLRGGRPAHRRTKGSNLATWRTQIRHLSLSWATVAVLVLIREPPLKLTKALKTATNLSFFPIFVEHVHFLCTSSILVVHVIPPLPNRASSAPHRSQASLCRLYRKQGAEKNQSQGPRLMVPEEKTRILTLDHLSTAS